MQNLDPSEQARVVDGIYVAMQKTTSAATALALTAFFIESELADQGLPFQGETWTALGEIVTNMSNELDQQHDTLLQDYKD